MGPKEIAMVIGGLIVVAALLFVTNWIKSRGGNNVNTKSQ